MYLQALIHEHRAICLMMNKSREKISHSTRQLPNTEHRVVNGHCEPGAQTGVWPPTCCWIYLGHRHECGCHQQAVGFTWGTGTIVTVTNMLCILGEGTLLPMLSKIHTAKKLSSFVSLVIPTKQSSLILAERRMLRGAGLLVCTLAMNDMSMSGFRKQRCNICLTIERERSYQ